MRTSIVPKSGWTNTSSASGAVMRDAPEDLREPEVAALVGDVRAEHRDEDRLRQLGRLELEQTEGDPALRALRRVADRRKDDDQKENADEVHHDGIDLEIPVVEEHGRDEVTAGEHEEHQLAVEERARCLEAERRPCSGSTVAVKIDNSPMTTRPATAPIVIRSSSRSEPAAPARRGSTSCRTLMVAI